MKTKENDAKKKGPVSGKSTAMELAVLGLFIAIILLMAFTPIGLIDLPVIKATILHVPVIIGAILLGPKEGALLGLVFGLTSVFKNTTAPSLLSFCFSPLIPVPGTGVGSMWALVISLLPRVLVGVIPYYIASFLKFFATKKTQHTANKQVKDFEYAMKMAEEAEEKERKLQEARAKEEGSVVKPLTEEEKKLREARKAKPPVVPKQAPAGIRAVIYALCGVVGSFTNTLLVMGLIGTLFTEAYAIAREVPVTEVQGLIQATIFVNGVPEAIAAAILVPIVCVALEKTGLIPSKTTSAGK